jgi:hypothetical protein
LADRAITSSIVVLSVVRDMASARYAPRIFRERKTRFKVLSR